MTSPTLPLPPYTAEGLDRVRRDFRLIRSKDAGPFMLTIDLFFTDPATHDRFRRSGVLGPDVFSALYRVPASAVESYDLDEISAMKISFPRVIISGDFGDTDITGGQQYAVLVEYLAGLQNYPCPSVDMPISDTGSGVPS